MRLSASGCVLTACLGLSAVGWIDSASSAGESVPTQTVASKDDVRVGWNQIVDLCTSPIPSVLSHIIVHEELVPMPTRQLDAVYRLSDAGLLVCLDRLTRSRGDTALVEAIERFEEGAPAGEHDRLRKAVWAIWRERGVETWLDATLQAGEPPEAVVGALRECIAPSQLAPRVPAPRIDVATADGTRYRLSERAGRFIVVSFWASWCKPCLPEIEQISRRLDAWNGKQTDPARRVDFVAINGSERLEEIATIVSRADLTSVIFAFDPIGQAMRDWGVLGLPATFLVDPDGRIVEAVMGEDLGLPERVLSLISR